MTDLDWLDPLESAPDLRVHDGTVEWPPSRSGQHDFDSDPVVLLGSRTLYPEPLVSLFRATQKAGWSTTCIDLIEYRKDALSEARAILASHERSRTTDTSTRHLLLVCDGLDITHASWRERQPRSARWVLLDGLWRDLENYVIGGGKMVLVGPLFFYERLPEEGLWLDMGASYDC